MRSTPKLVSFNKWFVKLQELYELKDGWDSYKSPKPSPEAIATAEEYLTALEKLEFEPTRVEASAMGGVGITHRQGARKVYVEFYNNGTVHALFSDRTEDLPKLETQPVAPDTSSFHGFIEIAKTGSQR